MRRKEYLLVDGYNIIHAWGDLKKTAKGSLSDARRDLLDILANYRGYKKVEVLVVFDAHMQKGYSETHEKYRGIHVVYTKEYQTADSYIERFAAKHADKYRITVASSDNLEQVIILSTGAYRLSANELYKEIKRADKEITEKYVQNKPVKNNMLFDNLDSETAKWLDEMRYGKD